MTTRNDNLIPNTTAALESVTPELEAMPESRVQRRLNLDASFAAETVIGNHAELQSIAPQLVERFGPMAAAQIEQLLILAAATKQAEIDVTLSTETTDLGPLSKQVVAMHASLLVDAQALARRGKIDSAQLEACCDMVGYRAQYHSLLSLEQLLRGALPSAVGMTALTVAELDAARELGHRMMSALGVREQSGSKLPAAEIRIRVLSLLVEQYEEVRRNVGWLRWYEDDAESFAPSLWSAQRLRRPAAPTESEPATPTAVPAALTTTAPTTASPAPAAPTTTTTPVIANDSAFEND